MEQGLKTPRAMSKQKKLQHKTVLTKKRLPALKSPFISLLSGILGRSAPGFESFRRKGQKFEKKA